MVLQDQFLTDIISKKSLDDFGHLLIANFFFIFG